MATKKIKISIAVTELAPLCGMDHYDNWPKIISKLWRKYNKADFDKCEAELRTAGHIALACDSTQKKLAALETKYGQQGALTNVVKQINSVKTKSSSALVSAQDNLISGLDTSMGPMLATQDKAMMAALIKSATNTMHGVSHEGNGLELFTKASGIKVVDTQASMNLVFYEDDKYIWEINGRLDGITDNGRLVEIKNRQKALFNTVRDYEMCQVQTYLHHKRMDMGYLVEILPGKSRSDTVCTGLQAQCNATGVTQILHTTPLCEEFSVSGTTYNILEVAADPEYFAVYIRPWLMRLIKFVTGHLFTSPGLKENILKGDSDKEAYTCYAGLECE